MCNLINFKTFLKAKILTATFVANSDVPALPGKQNIFFTKRDSDIFLHKACSLPPLPINPIFIIDFILYNLLMSKKKAKLIFKHNYFEIVEEGDYVLCAISGKEIQLKNLSYWNVDLQEAYFSSIEANERFKLQKK